jgi:branched-chain amino acid transport system ATP-binding protein
VTAVTALGAPILEARSLHAGYQGLAAVRDLDLVVHPGQVVALLGPNGAGKTTTIMTLAGVLPQISGVVTFNGLETTKPLHRRVQAGLALLTEQRAIAPALTTLDNLRLGRGNPERALALFPELKARLRTRARLLSGGEQQILALARILSTDARILLADELSLGLAPLVAERLFAAIQSAANEGLGVLLVEQMVDRALAVADECIVLVRGEVRLKCPASTLRGDTSQLSNLYFA